MAYQALYRKYRPGTLEDVVGQEAIITTLKNSIIEEKVSHAYLFTGPRGTGKTSVAKLFAKMVNCLHNDNGNPCGKCEICTKVEQKEVSDIIEIDAASNNGVDEIREIRNKANLVPSLCKYKVYIIDEVHMLSTGAFNALLKTLEEPPAHIIFILATTEVHKIPLTIMSRCQRYDFKKITLEYLVKRLTYIAEKENIKIDSAAIARIAETCDGGMRDSISLLDQLSGFQKETIMATDVDKISGNISDTETTAFIEAIFSGDIEYVLTKINEYNAAGKNLLKFVEKIIINLRNALLFANANDYFKRHYAGDYANLVALLKNKDIYMIIDDFNDLLLSMKNNSAHQILLEIKLMKIMTHVPKINIEVQNEISISKPAKKEVELPTAPIASPVTTPQKNDYQELIKVRVNNTFVDSNKVLLNNVKENWHKINEYTVSKEYSNAASLLLDGELRAVGTRNLIVSYPYESMADRANSDLATIEKFLEIILGEKYKFIGITSSEWQNYAALCLSKWNNKEKYEYIEEQEMLLPTATNKDEPVIDKAIELFGDLVKVE